jgi:murein DD-endopeptidase MepM/ murein hydrolase activator NlpD
MGNNGREVIYMLNSMIKLKQLAGDHKLKILIFSLVGLLIAGTLVFSFERFTGGEGMGKEAMVKSQNKTDPASSLQKINKPGLNDVAVEDFASSPQKAISENSALKKMSNEKMKWPGQGAVIGKMGYSYSETMGDVRYHKGIDIKLPPGYEVRAALSGTIKNINSTSLWGDEIVLSHEGDQETCYKGLKAQNFNIDQTIEQGQVIGIVTLSPKYEAKMVPHLHFEVYQKGKCVDPLSFLK